jgi:nucleotide-binding universal stress UspA family protein
MAVDGLRHILVPVDFSDLSALGLRYAGALAKCSGAKLSVLFANPFQPPAYFTASRVAELEKQFQSARRDAEEYLREFVAKTLPERTDVAADVIDAMPVDAILRESERLQPDVIVMGAHGRSGVNRLMMGSVAERLIRSSRIPVLTVRGDAPPAAGPAPVGHVLCPVNDTPFARKALHYAVRMARCFGAKLTVMHVEEPSGMRAIPDLGAWIPAPLRAQADMTLLTRQGEAAREVIAAASGLQAGMLVLGAHHQRFLDSSTLGATTVRILRHAPCAVLAVFTESGT